MTIRPYRHKNRTKYAFDVLRFKELTLFSITVPSGISIVVPGLAIMLTFPYFEEPIRSDGIESTPNRN